MFSYCKPLFFPINVQLRDSCFSKVLLEHYSGKDSEYSAIAQYLNQRSSMPNPYLRDLLGLIAAEEMGHLEMIAAAINKLGGPPPNFFDPQGVAWNISYIDQSLDPLTMLQADVEAEARAKILYDEHLNLTDDPGLQAMIKFLSAREKVHEQLFLKAQILILQGTPPENFVELINEYKSSLQTTSGF